MQKLKSNPKIGIRPNMVLKIFIFSFEGYRNPVRRKREEEKRRKRRRKKEEEKKKKIQVWNSCLELWFGTLIFVSMEHMNGFVG